MVDNSGGGSEEVELNLAPIIDCFTVLITYLLVTASFITLAALDVGVAANSDAPSASPPPVSDIKPLSMTLDLDAEHAVIVKVSGGDLKSDYAVKIPAKSTTWDEEALNKHLGTVTARWPDLKEASISAAPTILYRELVMLINSTQKSLPKVYISGS